VAPFLPTGEQAEWKVIYDHLRAQQPGYVVTFEKLDELLGRSFKNGRGPIYRAQQELEENYSRTLSSVRGQGYRVAQAEEHLTIGLNHSRRARKQLKRGVEVVEAADHSKLTPSMIDRAEAASYTMSKVMEFLGKMAKQVDDNTVAIAKTSEVQEKADDRITKLEELLKRRGIS
jgi:hypothetical protein